VIFMPASWATRTIAGTSASDCSWVRLMLARLCVSDAEITAFSSSGRFAVATAFCTPLTLGTNAM
jgi:hypothetical protein